MTVLFVDDDSEITESNAGYLESKGYGVLKAARPEEALPLAELADCAVIGVKPPDMAGFELAAAIIRQNPMPVLFAAAGHSDESMERAFALGGDYLKKPYSHMELYLRVGAMLQKASAPRDGMIRLPPMLIDTNRLSVRLKGEDLLLTPREYSVLMLLCKTPNRMFSHEALFRGLWGGGEISPHLVQQNVSTLRRKLEKAAPGIRFIETVHGSGYIFRLPPYSS